VTAVLGGLGAALLWSIDTTFASRAARAMGSMLTLAWVMLFGLLALTLVLPFSGSAHISGTSALRLFLVGAGNVGGLLLMYHSLRLGQIGVVMPIVSMEGGIAALIAVLAALAVLAGQAVGGVRGATLAVTVIGAIITAIARQPADPDPAAAALAPREPAYAVPGHRDPVPTPQGQGDRRAAV
jgi:drug/metabolite transporter (DMT)-like permease